eukprot:gene5792-4142_t
MAGQLPSSAHFLIHCLLFYFFWTEDLLLSCSLVRKFDGFWLLLLFVCFFCNYAIVFVVVSKKGNEKIHLFGIMDLVVLFYLWGATNLRWETEKIAKASFTQPFHGASSQAQTWLILVFLFVVSFPFLFCFCFFVVVCCFSHQFDIYSSHDHPEKRKNSSTRRAILS